MQNEKIRVRFAPSPTGYLHIGGARTALFNYLFARKHKAVFMLRIEDTDEARSTDESVGAIIESMKWLGLDWDEGPDPKDSTKVIGSFGPYFQMQRKEAGLYRKYVDELVGNGHAYHCYCTHEELETMRTAALAEKRSPKYDGRCCKLTPEERKKKESEGRSAVIRFKMPAEGKIIFEDIIRGRMEFDNNLLDDFVLMKTSGVPTYNFACVIDDALMKISHVIRGDDHLSNTPRQAHLYKALGWECPIFAHLSMILGPDGARLSKRHGHTSVLEYRTDGYLPEAMLNYLSLLGWATEDSQQLFTGQELFDKFSLERCSKSPAVFDPQKLIWMNGEYLRKLPPEELVERFLTWIKVTGQESMISDWDKELLKKVVILEQEKAKLLKDIPALVDFFFADNVEYKPEAVEKVFKTAAAKQVLEGLIEKIPSIADFSAQGIDVFCREYAAANGLKNGQVFHPFRVAVSGRTTGPSLFHMAEIMGKEKCLKRIKEALNKFF